MSKYYINKNTGLSVLSLTLLAMTGCMGTKHLSHGITEEGHVQQADIVFPELNEAWQLAGQFPNSENLAKIRPGVAKDELYQLIGRPHFSEAQHAREWDYIMKFYMPDESVKICQYKVIFDKEYKGQEFYWKPADCPPQKTPPVQPPLVQERFNLGADALFEFDKSAASNMLPKGRRELDELAQKLRRYQQMGESRLVVTGHTDRKGSESYNINLSTKRAHTVRNYLINQGINPTTIMAIGAGESQPVKQCSTSLPRQQEINCLQLNRRVTIDVDVSVIK